MRQASAAVATLGAVELQVRKPSVKTCWEAELRDAKRKTRPGFSWQCVGEGATKTPASPLKLPPAYRLVLSRPRSSHCRSRKRLAGSDHQITEPITDVLVLQTGGGTACRYLGATRCYHTAEVEQLDNEDEVELGSIEPMTWTGTQEDLAMSSFSCISKTGKVRFMWREKTTLKIVGDYYVMNVVRNC